MNEIHEEYDARKESVSIPIKNIDGDTIFISSKPDNDFRSALQDATHQLTEISGCEFEEKYLVGFDCSDVTFSSMEFDDCNFASSQFRNVEFRRCLFRDCKFDEGDMATMRIVDSVFEGTTFRNTHIANVYTNNCIYRGCSFEDTTVLRCNVRKATFIDSAFVFRNIDNKAVLADSIYMDNKCNRCSLSFDKGCSEVAASLVDSNRFSLERMHAVKALGPVPYEILADLLVFGAANINGCTFEYGHGRRFVVPEGNDPVLVSLNGKGELVVNAAFDDLSGDGYCVPFTDFIKSGGRPERPDDGIKIMGIKM